jgi:hypothetical protein
MNDDLVPRTRQINLSKLSLPYEKKGEPLTENEIITLSHQGVIRAAHYLQLAELYLMDLSKISDSAKLDRQVEAISEITSDLEQQLSSLIRK